MAVVDYDEQQRREGALKGFGGVLGIGLLLSAPFIGWLFAPFVAFWMAVQAYKKSSNRLLDIGLAFGGLIPYYGLVALTGSTLKDGNWFGVMLLMFIYSCAWGWLMHARCAVASD